jgi:hypothetical protein
MKTIDQTMLTLLVRTREDYQSMRKRIDNRLGIKANGKNQNVDRKIPTEVYGKLLSLSADARKQERTCEKFMEELLLTFPVYTDFLVTIKAIGPVSSAWIIGEFDIEIATTVSKMWQFAGVNPGKVRGNIARKEADYKPEMGVIVGPLPDAKDGSKRVKILTDTLIRGDALTEGFLAPYNKKLRAHVLGVMATNFCMQQNSYATEFYYPYKTRLSQSEAKVEHRKKGKVEVMCWKDVTKGHRDLAAKRYMMKMFLIDFHVAWREIVGLPVRKSYGDEYLGKQHAA